MTPAEKTASAAMVTATAAVRRKNVTPQRLRYYVSIVIFFSYMCPGMYKALWSKIKKNTDKIAIQSFTVS